MIVLPTWVLVIAVLNQDNELVWSYKEVRNVVACQNELRTLLASQQIVHGECAMYKE